MIFGVKHLIRLVTDCCRAMLMRLTWNSSVPTRATGESFPSTSANSGVVSDALLLHFNWNLEINAIWLTIVASSVVNVCTDSTDGLVHESPHDSETIAESAQINNSFDMIFDIF